MLDLGWEISFSFISLGQCKRLQWCRRHLKIENSTKYLCYIFDPNLAFTEICPFQGLLGGGFQTKGKITFETTRGISAQPSSSLSSHSGRKRKDEQGAGMGLWLENLQGQKRHAGTWRRRLRSGQTLQLQTPLCTWEIRLINCFQLSRTAE